MLGNCGEMGVSVVLPCLNEQRTVGICVRNAKSAIESMGYSGEVLVCDNGSTDRSTQIASDAGARVCHCAEKGYGAALRHGIGEARFPNVVIADADDSYDLCDLRSFILPLANGQADFVMGNRFSGGIVDGAMPLLNRYVGNPILSFVLRFLFGGNIRDVHCGIRSFTRSAYNRMGPTTNGMEFASELVVRALQLQLTLIEVPTTLRPDGRDRRPHLRPWRDGWRHLMYLFKSKWSGCRELIHPHSHATEIRVDMRIGDGVRAVQERLRTMAVSPKGLGRLRVEAERHRIHDSLTRYVIASCHVSIPSSQSSNTPRAGPILPGKRSPIFANSRTRRSSGLGSALAHHSDFLQGPLSGLPPSSESGCNRVLLAPQPHQLKARYGVLPEINPRDADYANLTTF